MKFPKWWTKFWLNPWMGLTVVFLLSAVISFFQINSYWADQHDFNGVVGWLGIGILLVIIGLFCAYKVNNTSDGKGG